MKKVLSGLILLTLLLPLVISAQEAPQECCRIGNRTVTVGSDSCTAGTIAGPTTASTCILGGQPVSINCQRASWGMICLLNTIYNVTDWIFIFLVAIVALFIIWGGVDIVTSGGNDEKVTGGRKRIMYAAVGLGVAILAKIIPSVVKLMIGAA